MSKYAFEVPDYKKVRVIVDTDAAGEADDPFAIVHALLSPKMLVKAVIAEHCTYPDSMQKSYEVIEQIAEAMDMEVPMLHGEEWPLDPEGEASEGVRFMIEEARKEDSRPLFILCMGPLSNPAKALQLAPDIAGRMTLVIIGGHSYDHMREFQEANFRADISAINTILKTEVNIWQIPVCAYGAIRVSLAELQKKVSGCGKIGEYLFHQMITYNHTKEAFWTPGESWSLGDSPAVSVVLDQDCGRWRMRPAHWVNADTSYSAEVPGRVIRVYDTVDPRFVLEDFFTKLALYTEN